MLYFIACYNLSLVGLENMFHFKYGSSWFSEKLTSEREKRWQIEA